MSITTDVTLSTGIKLPTQVTLPTGEIELLKKYDLPLTTQLVIPGLKTVRISADQRSSFIFENRVYAERFLKFIKLGRDYIFRSLHIPHMPAVLHSVSIYSAKKPNKCLKRLNNIILRDEARIPSSPATSTDTEPSSSVSQQSGDLSPSVSSESSQSNRSESPLVASTLPSIPEELEEEQERFTVWYV